MIWLTNLRLRQTGKRASNRNDRECSNQRLWRRDYIHTLSYVTPNRKNPHAEAPIPDENQKLLTNKTRASWTRICGHSLGRSQQSMFLVSRLMKTKGHAACNTAMKALVSIPGTAVVAYGRRYFHCFANTFQADAHCWLLACMLHFAGSSDHDEVYLPHFESVWLLGTSTSTPLQGTHLV